MHRVSQSAHVGMQLTKQPSALGIPARLHRAAPESTSMPRQIHLGTPAWPIMSDHAVNSPTALNATQAIAFSPSLRLVSLNYPTLASPFHSPLLSCPHAPRLPLLLSCDDSLARHEARTDVWSRRHRAIEVECDEGSRAEPQEDGDRDVER